MNLFQRKVFSVQASKPKLTVHIVNESKIHGDESVPAINRLMCRNNLHAGSKNKKQKKSFKRDETNDKIYIITRMPHRQIIIILH